MSNHTVEVRAERGGNGKLLFYYNGADSAGGGMKHYVQLTPAIAVELASALRDAAEFMMDCQPRTFSRKFGVSEGYC